MTTKLNRAKDRIGALRAQVRALLKRQRELEDRLFRLGAMEDAPCFCCGYNGPGYFQPETHPCAKRHHRLRRYED